jgi:hypothetical protein
MKKTVLASVALFVFPFIAFAQSTSAGNLGPLKSLVASVNQILNALIPVLIALALVVFFWGLVQYIRKPEISEGKNVMIAGILALFIMVSIWGIINLVQGALLSNQGQGSVTVPQVGGSNSNSALPLPGYTSST